MVKRNNAVARRKARHALAYGGHDTGCLMPIDTGRRQQIVLDLFKIGMTNTATPNFH
jgi:hypothetical protein